jgi:hypothetical protein
MGPAIAIILAVALFGGILWLALHFNRKNTDKTWNNFIRLGEQIGIQVQKPELSIWNPKLAQMDGNYKGFRTHVYTKRVQSGKHTYYYTEFNIYLPNNDGFTLRLVKEGFFQKIGKAFGGQDIQIGEPDFDKAFVLKSSDENRARQIFDLNTTNLLLSNKENISSSFELNNGFLHYSEQIMLSNEKHLPRYAQMIAIGGELAARITGGGQRARY